MGSLLYEMDVITTIWHIRVNARIASRRASGANRNNRIAPRRIDTNTAFFGGTATLMYCIHSYTHLRLGLLLPISRVKTVLEPRRTADAHMYISRWAAGVRFQTLGIRHGCHMQRRILHHILGRHILSYVRGSTWTPYSPYSTPYSRTSYSAPCSGQYFNAIFYVIFLDAIF